MAKYEVTTGRTILRGRLTRIVEADSFTQAKGTATFVANGRPVAVVKRVRRVC